ncbi:MAG TPA: hypothetical protein VGQ86_04260 [Candidatus Limnocylindria bacterium]|nr:hypothetical protein [Candidatus Limnocylindria bacterium]
MAAHPTKEGEMSVPISKRLALAAGAGTLTAALLGSAALAAFAPVTYDPASQLGSELGRAAPAERGGDKLKAVLAALVSKGVITQAQADAITKAVAEPATKPAGDSVKRIYANLLEESANYLGIQDLKTKLPGTSLGALADQTTGKSRTGLVATLQSSVNAAIDKLFAEGKITKEQADKAKADSPAEIAKFVDHVYEKHAATPPKQREPNIKSFVGDEVKETRDYLGISQADLVKALRDGKSLAEIANATPNKSRDGLVAALVSAANAKIDKALADVRITVDQATSLKAKVATEIAAAVDRKATTSGRKGPVLPVPQVIVPKR